VIGCGELVGEENVLSEVLNDCMDVECRSECGSWFQVDGAW
jgi:hypothetical protein